MTRVPFPSPAIAQIYAQVVVCGFFDLPQEFRDPRVMDGGPSGLTVTAAGRTHSVAVSSMRVIRVSSILRVLGRETQ